MDPTLVERSGKYSYLCTSLQTSGEGTISGQIAKGCKGLMNLPAESRIIGFILELFFELSAPPPINCNFRFTISGGGHMRNDGENFETLAMHIGQSQLP